MQMHSMHASDSGISLTVWFDLLGVSSETSTSFIDGELEFIRLGLKVGFVVGFRVVVV